MNLNELNNLIQILSESQDDLHKFLLNLGNLFGVNETNVALFKRKPGEAWSDYDRLVYLHDALKKNEGKHITNFLLPKHSDDEYLDIFYRMPKDIKWRLQTMNRLFADDDVMRFTVDRLSSLRKLCSMYGEGQHVRLFIEKAFDRNRQLNTEDIKIYIRHIYDNIIDILWGSPSTMTSSLTNYMPAAKIVRDANRAVTYASRYAWMLELPDEINYFDDEGKGLMEDEPKRTDNEA